MSFFEPPQLIEADVFAAVPAKLRKKGHPSSWIDANHPGSGLDCFLEGPAFDRDGNLYVVDIPYGRILRMSPTGEFGRPIRRMAQWTCDTPGWPRLHRRLSPRHHGVRSEDGPSPNGIALDPADNVLFVAMTRSNCMWHCPLKRGGGIAKVGVFAQLPGIHGPDGLAMDEAGNLSAAHARPGIVWSFSPIGEPLYRVQLTGKRRE
jgi:sugar lactone lactonase YvrE